MEDHNMTEKISVKNDADQGSGEFSADQWAEFMSTVESKTPRKISSTTIEGWVERLKAAFYDSVETLSASTALDLQESAGVPHLVGKIMVQTAQEMNDLTESEASKTSDAKVKVRTSQKNCGGSSDELIDYEDDEEIIIPVKKAEAPAEGGEAPAAE